MYKYPSRRATGAVVFKNTLVDGQNVSMSKTDVRRQKILEILQRDRAKGLVDLAGILGVSYMTIRRDMREMEAGGKLSVINGVAVAASESFLPNDRPYSLAVAGSQMVDAKNRIGRKAISFIENNDVIIIDTGSTTEFVARHLPDNMNITIICYTINVLVEVYKRPNCQIVFIGGFFHDDTLMFESPEGLALIRRHRANKAFISATGVSETYGVMCDNHYECPMKRTIIESSVKKFLLFDSSKYDRVRIAHYAELGDFDAVITDSGAPKTIHGTAKKFGLDLHLV